VALPIFEPILQAVWAQGVAPKAPLDGPSPEAKRYLVDLPIDYTSGSRGSRGNREGFVEHFRIGADGKMKETQYQLAPRDESSTPRRGRSAQQKLTSPEARESTWEVRSAKPEARGGYGAWGWGG
jgi:hypothetical protein